MKAKATTETPTPLLEREEADHARLTLSGLPKGGELVVAVTYEDRFDTITYELGSSPKDGTAELTFPKLGKGGVARVGRRGDDGEIESVGKPIPLDSE